MERSVTPIQHSAKAALGGILVGVGLGGLLDGVVLRQILQWHHMLSNWVPLDTLEAARANILWDGVFQAVMWVITLTGVLFLWAAARQKEYMQSLKTLIGQFVFGWGLLNLAEGTVNQVFGMHNVREVAEHAIYNWTFLAVGGVLFVVAGWSLMKAGRFADEGLHLKLPGFDNK